MSNLSTGKLGASVKILPIDLTPIIQGLMDNEGQLPVVHEFKVAPTGGLMASIEQNLTARSEKVEGLFLPHILSCFTIGEAKIELMDSVVGADVIIMPTYNQPVIDNNPVAAGIMRALILNNYVLMAQFAANVAERAGAERVHLFSPYSAYERSDKKHDPRSGILAKAVAKMYSIFASVTGVHLHAQQIEGFYENSFFNVTNNEIFMLDFLQTDPKDINKKRPIHTLDEAHFNALFKNAVIASPDIGGSTTAKSFATDAKEVAALILAHNNPDNGKTAAQYKADLPDIGFAAIDKRRDAKKQQTSVFNVIYSGSLKRKRVILIDDILDTGGTLINAAQAFKDRGATAVAAYVTHPVLSGNAAQKIENSPLSWIGVANSFNETGLLAAQAKTKKIRIFDLGPALAQIVADLSTAPKATILSPERYVGGELGADLRKRWRCLPAALANLNSQ